MTTDEKVSFYVDKVARAVISTLEDKVKEAIKNLQPMAGQTFMELMYKVLIEVDLNILLNTFDQLGQKDTPQNKMRFFDSYNELFKSVASEVAQINHDQLERIYTEH